MNHVWAGVGRADVTPSPGTPQGGWGAQTHQRGLGADLPFYATALALSDGNQIALIVEVDAIGFDADWTQKIVDAIVSQTGIPRERIRFSCSHTHSGPNTFRLPTISEGLEMALSYLEALPERIAGAAWQAQTNLRQVRVAAGAGECDINVNRRICAPDGSRVSGLNWDGPVDRTVRVIRLDTLDEQPLAVIVHYACHPTIMAWENQWFTPDYPGPTRSVVEQQVGGTCLFLQGAAGDIGPRAGYSGDLRVYRRQGTILGLEAAKVALTLDTLPRRRRLSSVLQSGAPIAIYVAEAEEPPQMQFECIVRSVPLPVRLSQPVADLEAEADRLQSELVHWRKQGTTDQIRAATARSTQARWRAEMARQYAGKTTVDWQIQCIRLGPIALLSCPGEPFTETAKEVVTASPFEHTLFSGYSNGGFGYIPTAQAFNEGGYEVEASPFAAQAADALARESIRLLREMAGEALNKEAGERFRPVAFHGRDLH